MIGMDFQDKLDAIVRDLQTTGKGQTVQILLRDENNTPFVLPLSADTAGIVSVSQLAAIQGFVNTLKPFADTYESERIPVTAALDAFKMAQEPHEALTMAATLARKNLNDALMGDPAYQAAKTALDAARLDVNYIDAVEAYRVNNVSENFGNLSDAKGKYVVSQVQGGGGIGNGSPE